MYKISKEFHFSASHILTGLPEGHPCGRLHGHNYIFIMELESNRLNDYGFVKDYRDLDNVKNWIDTVLDHRHLNDIFDFQPSAENIARYIFDLFIVDIPELKRVYVKETEKTIASYGI